MKISTRKRIIAYLQQERYTIEEISKKLNVKNEDVIEIARKMWGVKSESERIYLKTKYVRGFKSDLFSNIKSKHCIILKELKEANVFSK